jgi:hypothetical protein
MFKLIDAGDTVAEHFELCFISLANLTLVKLTHEIVWQVQNLKLFLEYMERLILYLTKGEYYKIQKDYKIFKSVFRIVTNCLMSDETALTLDIEEYQPVTEGIIKVFEFFNNYKTKVMEYQREF